MSDAYVDTSVMVAIAAGEPPAAAWFLRLKQFDHIRSAGLLDAEFRSACRRDGRPVSTLLLGEVELISPPRALTAEITRVLDAGYVRGADCWHLATALYLSPDPSELVFLTLDERQRDVATALGFVT